MAKTGQPQMKLNTSILLILGSEISSREVESAVGTCTILFMCFVTHMKACSASEKEIQEHLLLFLNISLRYSFASR